MNSSGGDSNLLEKTNLTMQEIEESTIVNNSNNLDETDPTLTSADFSLITNGTTNDVSENSLHANVNPESQETFNNIEDALTKHANSIVDEAIDSATLSLRSSGDFSLLNDAELLKTNSEIVENLDNSEKGLDKNEETNETKLEPDKKKEDEWLDILGKTKAILNIQILSA